MNRIIFILMLSLVTLTSNAFASDRKEWCEVTSVLAETIMLSRQGGETLSNQIDLQVQATKPGTRMRAATLIMVYAAHNIPIAESEAGKRNTSTKFRDQWYFDCLDGIHD